MKSASRILQMQFSGIGLQLKSFVKPSHLPFSVKNVEKVGCRAVCTIYQPPLNVSILKNNSKFCSMFSSNYPKSSSVASCLISVRLIHSNSELPINISLQTLKKRVPRKKKVDLESEMTPSCHNVFAFATAEEYNLEALREGLVREDLYNPSNIDDFGKAEVLYVEARYHVSNEPRHIYFFREGAVVFWNMSVDECMSVLDFVKRFEQSSYDENLVLNEQEMMAYAKASPGKKSGLDDGLITLATDQQSVQIALDKYTFSNAIALSVKLGVWEGLLERYISSIEYVTEDLKLGNKIRISREEALKKTGELFALRHKINLSSDVLDVPDFYWDREELEKLYIKMCNYFSISRRTKVVNEKINHCLELVDLISSHLNDNHHVRLEWMIIILIMVEVGIEVLHYMHSSEQSVKLLENLA